MRVVDEASAAVEEAVGRGEEVPAEGVLGDRRRAHHPRPARGRPCGGAGLQRHPAPHQAAVAAQPDGRRER